MAVYKVINNNQKSSSNGSVKNLKRVINYVSNKDKERNIKEENSQKLEEENIEKCYRTTGINISSDTEKAFKDMLRSKEINNHSIKEGRQYRHHIQSFAPNEATPELAHKIGVEFAETYLSNFDVFVATHQDKEHIHNHFIINTTCNKNGKKLDEVNINKYLKVNGQLKENELFLYELQFFNDKICKKYGLSVIDNNTKYNSDINTYSKENYFVYKKHIDKKESSYKIDLAYKIKEISKEATSINNFKYLLSKENINVFWSDKKKNVTFTFKDSERKAIRLSNLEKTYNDDFFKKENLEEIFSKNLEKKLNNSPKIEKEILNNEEEINRAKELKNKSYYLTINKVSKNKYFKLDKESGIIKERISKEKNPQEKLKLAREYKEKLAELKELEKSILEETPKEIFEETVKKVESFYDEKIKALEEERKELDKKLEAVKKEFTSDKVLLGTIKKNEKEIERLKEFINKSEDLALNKISKNKYFKLDKEVNLLKEEVLKEKNSQEKLKLAREYKEKLAELKELKKSILEETPKEIFEEIVKEIKDNYSEKIEALEKEKEELREQFLEKRESLKIEIPTREEVVELKKEILKYKENIEKIKKIDVTFEALNIVTRGEAKKIVNEFNKINKEKEKLLKEESVFGKIKNIVITKELEKKQVQLQSNFKKLKEENIKETFKEVDKINTILKNRENQLIQKIEVNQEKVNVYYKTKDYSKSKKNNINLKGGSLTPNNEKESRKVGSAIDFDLDDIEAIRRGR